MDNRILSRFVLLVALLAIIFAPSVATADDWKEFNATGVEYSAGRTPEVIGTRFKSKIKIFDKGVKIIQIENYTSKSSKPDVTIKIAITASSVGSLVFDKDMNLVAEYTDWQAEGRNVYSFSKKVQGNINSGRWFIGKDYLMRDFFVTDKDGQLLFQETTIYRHKKARR